jgi:hypothetical protein
LYDAGNNYVYIFTFDSNLTIIGNTLKIYCAVKVIERKELKTNEETVKMLKDFF